MGLLEQHKAERKDRILNAARDLIARRGYHGLTMRELAREARVSVPTLYNLFGGKDAILAAELVSQFARTQPAAEAQQEFLARVLSALDGGIQQLERARDFYRQLVQVFLTSVELQPIRRRIEQLYVARMTATLRQGQQQGHLVPWIDVEALARLMFGQFLASMVGWGLGEFDLDGLRNVALGGICLMLLGVARGDVAERLRRMLEELQTKLPQPTQEVSDVVTRAD